MKKILFILLLVTTTTLFAGNYALVIGNSDYASDLGALKNPVNDAKDIAYALQQIDFNVTTILNGSEKEIKRGLKAFKNSLSENDTALFY